MYLKASWSLTRSKSISYLVSWSQSYSCWRVTKPLQIDIIMVLEELNRQDLKVSHKQVGGHYNQFVCRNRTLNLLLDQLDFLVYFTEFIKLFMYSKKVDKYVIPYMNRPLGKGQSEVHLAHLKDSPDQQFAIKIISKLSFKKDVFELQSLFTEILIMKRLNSPNIVKLIDVLQTQNNFYLVLEYCSGGDLRRFLRQNNHLRQEQAITVIIQILKGFLVLINKGIIHRDIKPENILIDGQRNIKLGDFGFSRNVKNHNNTMLNTMAGTPLYMSPQVLLNESYSYKADIWSLGVIFYQLLEGVRPYEAMNQISLVQKIKKGFRFERIKNPIVMDFIQGCLKQNQEERFSWEDIYKHQIFQGFFTEVIKRHDLIREKAQFIRRRLHLSITSNNIDLRKLFSTMDQNGDQQLDKSEFCQLILSIQNNITKEQFIFLFNQIDKDGNGTIDLKQLQVWLGILSTEQQSKLQVTKKSMLLVARLNALVKSSNVLQCFNKFDIDDSSQLNLSQFMELLKKLDIVVELDQGHRLFMLFDTDRSGTISFEEFKVFLGKSTEQSFRDRKKLLSKIKDYCSQKI